MMRAFREWAIRCVAVLVGLGLAAVPAASFPDRMIQLVVSFPAGTPPDVVARVILPGLRDRLGQNVIIDNRAGAAGNIGADHVAKSAPDGHTLLISSNGPIAVNKELYKSLPYDPQRDLEPISLIAESPLVLVVRPDFPARTFAEFVARAQAEPGRLSYASTGIGNASHLTMELLKKRLGIDVVHVPYRGSPAATTDIISGRVDAMFAIGTGVLPLVREGKLRALLVSARSRSSHLPDVPTAMDIGQPDLVSSAWISFHTTGRTPPEIVRRLHEALSATLATPEVRANLTGQGYDVVNDTPDSFRRFIAEEATKWSDVVRQVGAKVSD